MKESFDFTHSLNVQRRCQLDGCGEEEIGEGRVSTRLGDRVRRSRRVRRQPTHQAIVDPSKSCCIANDHGVSETTEDGANEARHAIVVAREVEGQPLVGVANVVRESCEFCLVRDFDEGIVEEETEE